MLIKNFIDNKSVPEGPALAIANGIGIFRCRGMMYWLAWGEHTFDIRTMWKILGLKEESFFLDSFEINPEFYTSFICSISGKDFNDLIRQNDEFEEAA